jgi:hypothetical protein
VAIGLTILGLLLRDTNRHAKAESLFQRAPAICEKAFGENHPHVAIYMENYALLLRNMGRPDEATPLESRAKTIRAKTLAKELGFMADCFTNREARFLCGLKQERDIERLVATVREMNSACQRANPLGRGINLDPS